MTCEPVKLYFEESGSGTPVILIHGFPLDHTIWLPVVEHLKSHARLILPDLRGFGQSPMCEDVSSMRLMAEDIHAVMDQLGIEKAILVGHSMGGYASLAFARVFPRRLLGLGLVTTQAAADTLERRQARLTMAADVKRKGVKAYANPMAAKYTCAPEWIEPIKELMLKSQPAGVIAALKGMAERPDATDWLTEIKVPCAVVVGTQDALIPPERTRSMVQMLNHAWLVEIPNAGHMPMLETPQVVANALIQLVNLAK